MVSSEHKAFHKYNLTYTLFFLPEWVEKYPDCGGKRQSPFEIKNEHWRDLSRKITWSYDAPLRLIMENNGHFCKCIIISKSILLIN